MAASKAQMDVGKSVELGDDEDGMAFEKGGEKSGSKGSASTANMDMMSAMAATEKSVEQKKLNRGLNRRS